MTDDDPRLNEARAFYARQMAAASRSTDPRLERIFELVPREAFMPPGPWHVMVAGRYLETPSADPVHLYQNALVSLDRRKGINNGEPFLHAAWIGAIAPQPGETVVHVGAGTGYYTAILAMLVLESGRVFGIEIDDALADAARRNCAAFENVSIIHGNAAEMDLPPADILYVNAGVVAPPARWLTALKPGGRLLFPWRPSDSIAAGVLAVRRETGFSARSLGGAWFIPCIGASDPSATIRAPDPATVEQSRSLHLIARTPPDESATAVYKDVWFSTREVG